MDISCLFGLLINAIQVEKQATDPDTQAEATKERHRLQAEIKAILGYAEPDPPAESDVPVEPTT